MKQFFDILSFEFGGYMKNKVFMGITVAIVVAIGIALSYPTIASLFDKGETDDGNIGGGEKSVILLSDKTADDETASVEFFKAAMVDKEIQATDMDEEEIKNAIDKGEYAGAIVITSPTKYKYILQSKGLYDSTQYMIDEIMANKYKFETLASLGVPPQKAGEILSVKIESEIIQTGKDQFSNYFYTYAMMFLLYMSVLLYGQFVATGVASEKSSRAMEVLITSAKPTNLMFGKVIGTGLAGLFQMLAIVLSGYLFYNLNKEAWGDNAVIESLFGMPASLLIYIVIFFITGFFIYAFLYGAIGSLASKLEDINTSILPITFVFIIAFFVVVYSMNTDVNNPLMIAASYIPFTSPMAMFVRIALGEVAWYEILISIAILIATTIGIGVLSAKIYKIGVLMYGKPPKMADIMKAIRTK